MNVSSDGPELILILTRWKKISLLLSLGRFSRSEESSMAQSSESEPLGEGLVMILFVESVVAELVRPSGLSFWAKLVPRAVCLSMSIG